MEAIFMEKPVQQQQKLLEQSSGSLVVRERTAVSTSSCGSSTTTPSVSVAGGEGNGVAPETLARISCSSSVESRSRAMPLSCTMSSEAACAKSGSSVSAPTSPTDGDQANRSNSRCELSSIPKQTRNSLQNNSNNRRVQFPTDDNIVTGYCDAPDPWTLDPVLLTPENLLEAYRSSCAKQGIVPLENLMKQIGEIRVFDYRTHTFNLSGEALDPRQCEALEEILKRVQFKSMNLQSCSLSDEGSSALFDMIEYYESTNHLNISDNKGIDMLGWQTCSRMLKKTSCLKHLEMGSNGLTEQVMLVMGRALRLGSVLMTLNVENSRTNSRTLAILVAALKLNTSLKKLNLSNNKISAKDAIQISNLLKSNTSIKYLDLSNNNLEDSGLETIVEGLSMQSKSGLETIILDGNLITSKGMYNLASLLPFCNVRGISLSTNEIGDEGISALREALHSAELTYLSLQNTRMTCEGALSVSDIISHNARLRTLDCRENPFKASGIAALAEALKKNTVLSRLELDPPPEVNEGSVLDTAYLDIVVACERNKKSISPAEVEYLKDLESQTFETVEEQDIPLKSPCDYNQLEIGSPPSNRFHVKKVKNSSSGCMHHSSSLDAVSTNLSPVPKMIRSASVGSWYLNGKSSRNGRFSVSPVPDVEIAVLPSAKETNACSKKDSSNEDETFFPLLLPSSLTEADNEKVDDEAVELSSTNTTPKTHKKKKTSFLLPDDHSDDVKRNYANVNRRMSTPNISAAIPIVAKARPKIPSLKTLVTLDSLDLKSSVPLSPTRLSSCFDMPDPVSLRLPVEVEEYLAKLAPLSSLPYVLGSYSEWGAPKAK